MDTSGEKLELYLDFSEIEGTQVIDRSGADRHGNLPDGFIFQVDPVVGGCLSFNGTSDYIELPEKLTIDYSDGFTVEAWVYYLSFNRWSRIIDFGNGAGQDNILFANFEQTNNLILQIYQDSSVSTLQAENVLRIGVWLHLAATISPNGEAILYVDGQQVARGPVHLPGLRQQNNNYIGRSHGEADGYFQGKMANVRVYSRVLTGAEIQQDWNADKIVIPPSTHPLNFSLLDDNRQPTLCITDDLKGHNLYFEVSNTSSQVLRLEKLKLEGTPENCYLELGFRPKILPTDKEFLKLQQSGQKDWAIEPWLQKDGSVSLCFCWNNAIEQPTLKPREKSVFKLLHMQADGVISRETNVRLKYNYYLGVDQPKQSDIQPTKGSRLKRLNIVSQRGKRNIPLHVGFIGSNTIFSKNDTLVPNQALPENQLVLQIANALEEEKILLNPEGSIAPSKFIISFDVQVEKKQKDWALATKSQVAGIHFAEVLGWNIKQEIEGETPEWIFTLQKNQLPELAAGQVVQLRISQIISSLPFGYTNLYLRYENIPGYWDGQFVIPIEKAPILYRGNKVGIGTTNPQVELDVVGDIRTTGIITGSSLPPNLIRNSYMNILDGTKPAGYSVLGNVTLEAVHPYTQGFEGPYIPEKPPNAASSVDTATQANPYWFGVYNKGSRASRGGLADGWHSCSDGKILKITGDNSTPGQNSIFFPFERNVLTGRVHFKAWLKIVLGDKVGFGVDAGYRVANPLVQAGIIVTKQQTDLAPDGWYQIDEVIDISKITSLEGLAFSMGIETNGKYEVYLALPYLANVDRDSWLPSVSDMLSRDGLTVYPAVDPGSAKVGIGTTQPGDKLSIQGGALSFHNPDPGNPVPYVGFDYEPTTDALRIRGNINTAALNTSYITIKRTTGNIGIGTTSPSGKLQIDGGGSDAKIKFGGTGGDAHHLSSQRDMVFNSQNGIFYFRKTTFDDLSKYTTIVQITEQGMNVNGGITLRGGSFSVAGEASDGTYVSPPPGTTTDSWNILVSPKEAIVGQYVQGIMCKAEVEVDPNRQSEGSKWKITMRLNGDQHDEWVGGSDKKVNYILIPK